MTSTDPKQVPLKPATPNLVLPTSGDTEGGGRLKSRSLSALIAKLNAAVADVGRWSTREDQLSDQFRKSAGATPKVKGGTRPPSRIVMEGRPDIELEGGDWFYSSREDILKDEEKAIYECGDGKSEGEIFKIQDRFEALLTDWDAQAAANESKTPRGYAHAKRMLNKAHCAWSAAEDEIVNYRPRTLEEIIELMAYTARHEPRGDFFTPNEDQLKFMMQNIAEVLVKLTSRAG